MEEEGVKRFLVMAADAPLASRVSRAVSVLAPEGAESDKHLFLESCLQDDWTDDYAKSEAFAAEYRAVTDPDDGQKWPKGLTEEDGKLYRNGKLLVPESRVLELCEAWHHHMLHPGGKKQALDMQRRFEIDHIGRDPLGRGLPLSGDGMAMDAKEFFARQEQTARDIRQQLEKEHAERQKSAPSSTALKCRVGDPVWVIRPRPMGTHRTKTWFTPGEVVRRIGEDTYRIKVGHGQFRERHESQLRVRKPDLRG